MTWPKKPTHLQTYLPKYPPLREAMASQKLDALPSFAFKLLVTYWAILFFRSSVFSFSTVSSVYKVYTVFACDSCDKYHVCQNWTKSYLTTVPKLVVTLSHSAVTTSVLVLMSGKSLAVQFTAVDKKKIRHFSIFGSWLTVACVRHEIFPIPIKPVVSPSLAPHFPLPLKACWSDRSDTKR